MRILTLAAFLVASTGLLDGIGVATPSAHADEDWWSDLDKGEAVQLEDILARPRTHAGRPLTFFAILRGEERVYVPQTTLFSRTRFANLAVWPDGTPLWEEQAYVRAEYPFLYVARSHPAARSLLKLPRYTRLEITAQVRAFYRGKPCMEVLTWRPTSHRLGKETVDAVVRADGLAHAGNKRLAMKWYEQALRPDLPPLYQARIRKRMASALRGLGALDEAAAVERGTHRPAPRTPRASPTPTPDALPPSHFGDASPGATPALDPLTGEPLTTVPRRHGAASPAPMPDPYAENAPTGAGEGVPLDALPPSTFQDPAPLPDQGARSLPTPAAPVNPAPGVDPLAEGPIAPLQETRSRARPAPRPTPRGRQGAPKRRPRLVGVR